MTSKTLLKLSFLKGIKEKFNLHESPVNAQTKVPANPTDGKVNTEEKPAQDDLNKDRSTSEEDDLSYDTKIYVPTKNSVFSSTDNDQQSK
jgi:hypothetical protein